MPRIKDRIGERHGRLLVLSFAGLTKDKRCSLWLCRCDCGVTKTVRATILREDSAQSCGCFRREKGTTHGLSETKTYQVWLRMKDRCRPGSSKRRYYYDKGVTVCASWASSYVTFLRDMGECPPGCTLDRIDNDGLYAPKNCRWVPHSVQCNNRSSNRLIAHDGLLLNLSQWAKKTGLQAGTVAYRLSNNWPARLALDATVTLAQARRISEQYGGGR